MFNETKRERLDALWGSIEENKQLQMPEWRDIADYIAPNRFRDTYQDKNNNSRRRAASRRIINTTAPLALRTLRSGMSTGLTNPSRPWFRILTPNPALNEVGNVKNWLHVVTMRLREVFIRSNLYNALPIMYGDAAAFGVSAMAVLEDSQDVMRCYTFPVGSYGLAISERGVVDTFMREYEMTVRQCINSFGDRQAGPNTRWKNFSRQVREAYDKGNYERVVRVRHSITPNPDFNPGRGESKNKLFSSNYWEISADDKTTFLRESGFDYFPILAARWDLTCSTTDIYGIGIGQDVLPDAKSLQALEKKAAKAVSKIIDPPMTAPTSLRNDKISLLDGDVTFVDVREGQQGFRPAHEVRFDITASELKIREIEKRIQRAFYEDLFLMLAQSDRRQFTAREIDERSQEKLLVLGPVLEQLNDDALDPLIDIGFQLMIRFNMLPRPPKELENMELRVEYTSIMAQAQKMVGLAGIDRFMGYVSQIVGYSPEAMDKVDIDQSIDEYGDITGIPPHLIRSDDSVDEIRANRAEAMAAQQQAEQMQMLAKTGKDMSQTDLSSENALTALRDTLGMATGGNP